MRRRGQHESGPDRREDDLVWTLPPESVDPLPVTNLSSSNQPVITALDESSTPPTPPVTEWPDIAWVDISQTDGLEKD